MSGSQLYLHLELTMRADETLRFICSNIQASSTHGVYIFQLIRHSKPCVSIRITMLEGCC